jgi:hypothetical protein
MRLTNSWARQHPVPREPVRAKLLARSTHKSLKLRTGIDPKLLTENKDWLEASKSLYNATQGHNWDESKSAGQQGRP